VGVAVGGSGVGVSVGGMGVGVLVGGSGVGVLVGGSGVGVLVGGSGVGVLVGASGVGVYVGVGSGDWAQDIPGASQYARSRAAVATTAMRTNRYLLSFMTDPFLAWFNSYM
jgi:Ca2+-binding RTX toxin-like protein